MAMAREVAEVGQIWKRKPPGKERVEVQRVWEATRNLMDEALGYGNDGEIVTCARCHPLHGGKPLVIPVADLENEFSLEEPHTDE